MHRFYLPPGHCQDAKLLLTGREAHHARDVLRVRRGERVTVLDGTGHEFLCEVQECERDQISLAVVNKRLRPAPTCAVTLLQAVPKAKTMDAIIQKATELGASRIVPVLSERVVAHLNEKEAAHKATKWRLVAIEAVKQCGSAWLPEVETPVSPSRFLARNEAFELSLIASLESGSHPLRDHLRPFVEKHGRMPKSVSIWVGPEGDFTPAETAEIKSHGVLPITLGRLVLRVETAVTYCLSILAYELQAAPSEKAEHSDR